MSDVLQTLSRWAAEGEDVVLATLVSVRGSAPMRPGARLLVTRSGRVAGSVSGGCVEADVVRVAGEVLQNGRPQLVSYALTDAAEAQVGLGCGAIDVLVQRFESGPVWDALVEAVAAGRPCAVAIGLGGEVVRGRVLAVLEGGETLGSIDPAVDPRVVSEAAAMLDPGGASTLNVEHAGGETAVFVEAFARPPRLFVVGATDIGTHLCRFAKAMGFDVTIVDPRRVFANAERFPDADRVLLEWPDAVLERSALDGSTSVVTLTHDAKFDLPTLAVALRSNAAYIGALGSVRTHARRKAALASQGFGETDLERIHAPVGLDLGGRSPEEIALSIVAELVAVRHGRGRGRETTGTARASTPPRDRG